MMERKLRNQEESEPEARHPKPTALFQLFLPINKPLVSNLSPATFFVLIPLNRFAGQICQYHLICSPDTRYISSLDSQLSWFKRCNAILIIPKTLTCCFDFALNPPHCCRISYKNQYSGANGEYSKIIKKEPGSNFSETYFGYRTRFETNQEGTRGSWVNEAKMHTNTGNIFVVVREPKGIILGSFSASQVARRKIYLRLTKAPVKPNLWYIDQILAMLETYLPNELGISVDLDLTPHGIWVPLVTKMVNAGCTGARKLVVGNHEANLSGGPLKQSSKPQFGVGPSV
ncbi:hypothetical protein F5877DRAFT_73479 [Lentinula edodes]|nr:hypothetical protein F5877DRAFT_73479 [Lentinula edodes]